MQGCELLGRLGLSESTDPLALGAAASAVLTDAPESLDLGDPLVTTLLARRSERDRVIQIAFFMWEGPLWVDVEPFNLLLFEQVGVGLLVDDRMMVENDCEAIGCVDLSRPRGPQVTDMLTRFIVTKRYGMPSAVWFGDKSLFGEASLKAALYQTPAGQSGTKNSFESAWRETIARGETTRRMLSKLH